MFKGQGEEREREKKKSSPKVGYVTHRVTQVECERTINPFESCCCFLLFAFCSFVAFLQF
jgi:hypothetical protein